MIQSLVGASLFDDGALVLDEVSDDDPGAFSVTDFGTLPTVGVVGMQPLSDGPVHVGLEGSLLFSWWRKDGETVGGGTSPSLSVDSSIWLTDLALGPYVSTSLNRTFRFYASAGGSMTIGVYSAESNELNDDPSDTTAAVGPYARAGVEILLGDESLLGLGVRSVWSELDFGGDASDFDLGGVQVFLTYSIGSAPFFASPHW